jgi:hypothetical protein
MADAPKKNCFRCDSTDKSVKKTADTETTKTKDLPDAAKLDQGVYTVHDDCGCTKYIVVDENGNATVTNTPPGGDPTTPEKPASLIDSVWDYIKNWIANADIFDWLKAALILGGLIYGGSKLLDQFNKNGDENSPALSHPYDGSPVFTQSYVAPTLQQVVATLCEIAQVECDVFGLSQEPILMTIGNNVSINTILQQLGQIYMFDVVQSPGPLRFKHRYVNDQVDTTINLVDMGYSDNSANLPDKITVKRLQGLDLPRSIALTYFMDELNDTNFTQMARLPTYVSGNDIAINASMTLSHQKAKDIAEIILMAAHIERTSYIFNTSYKYIHVEPGDIVRNDHVGNMRVTKITESSEGVLSFEAVNAGIEDSLSAYGQAPAYPVPHIAGGSNQYSTVTESNALFIDPPYMIGEDLDQTRLLAAIHGYGNPSWTGASVYVSRNGGSSYTVIANAQSEATFGLCAATLAGCSAPNVLDLASSISVTLKTGSLNSVTDVELNNGANLAYIGQELIGYGVATLTGEKTYTLSRLLRGRSGTKMFISQHTPNELFVLKNSLTPINLSPSDVGQTLKFKVVSTGQSVSSVDAQDVTVASNNLKLWQPTNGGHTLSGTTHNFTWSESIRKPNSTAPLATPHDISWTAFAIGVYDVNANLKSKQVVTTSSWSYPIAQQTIDFGTAPTHFYISVVPISMQHGNGYPLTINV